jgi:lipopolysaccharide export system permease protein
MTLLSRYCLRELVMPFIISLGLVTFIFLVGNLLDLADLLVNKGVSVFDVAKLLILIIPELIGFILPTGALASVLLVFGGFAQNNEILAIKASGVNLLRVFTPVIGAAFLLSLLSLFLVDQIQPVSEYRSRQLVRKLVVQHPEAYLESGRFIKDFEDYTFWINKIKGKRLEGVTIFQHGDGEPTRTMMAEWAQIVSQGNDKTLAFELHNGTSDEPNADDPTVFYKLNFKTFLLKDVALGKASGGINKKAKEMTIDELLYKLEHSKKQGLQDKEERIIKSEIHKKISFSFATLVFVLIGLPAAVISRRGEAVVSFGIAMGVVAFYYVLFVTGRTIAINGYLPAWLALWLPNVLLVCIAAILCRKMVRL